MGKIVVAEFVSIDDVIENPAWTAPFWTDRIAAYKSAELDEADALLLGRNTYEMFAASWPEHPEEGAAIALTALPPRLRCRGGLFATTGLPPGITEVRWPDR